MEEVKALLQPFMLNKVIDTLMEIEGLPGVAVSEVRGLGKGRGGSMKEQR